MEKLEASLNRIRKVLDREVKLHQLVGYDALMRGVEDLLVQEYKCYEDRLNARTSPPKNGEVLRLQGRVPS